MQAWVGARIIDGTGKPAIENATLVIRDGHIEAVGDESQSTGRRGTNRCDRKDNYPRPDQRARPSQYAAQFGIYLRDGITTILSLGGAKEFALREQSAKAPPEPRRMCMWPD